MSVYFEVDGTVIWNPATTVGRLFAAHVNASAATVGRMPPFECRADDTVQCSPEYMRDAFHAMSDRYSTSGSRVLHDLAGPELEILAALLERLGFDVELPTGLAHRRL